MAISLGLLVGLGMAELTLRWLAQPTSLGPRVRNTRLPPNDWDALRHHMMGVWKKASEGDLSYLAYDPELGWTPGVNRSSANGLYFTGPDGLRTSRVGEALATGGSKRRIAVLGDSHTFGEEVYSTRIAFQRG